ncbi:MAG: branched-chain amino acid ABC transporter permease [Pseudomonadota bacterium]
MELLHQIFVSPFVEMGAAPDLLIQVVWEGFVSGILYALIALGFVLIFKASGVFNFAQGIMMVFSALSLVSIYALLTKVGGLPSWAAAIASVISCIAIMFALAWSVERIVLRPLVNQPDIILFMATIGLNSFLIGFGETIFGGEPKTMITSELGLPTGSTAVDMFGGLVIFQHLDVAAAVIAGLMVAALAIFFNVSKIGRALRAVADDHQAAQSVGITLQQIWVIVWFAAGIVAIVAGIMWGARSDVSFALEILALKALPVLILGGFTSIPGAIVGGLIIGISEKIAEFYWGPMVGGSIESWFPYFLALAFLLFRPQGLFGDKIIERI